MTHHEINKSSEHLVPKVGAPVGAILVALTAVDVLAARKEQKGKTDKADVITVEHSGEFSNFIVPGYHTDGRVLAKNLDRHLEQLGTMHYAVHPEKGFSIDSIKEEWLKAREADGHRPARIYAMSMGALLLAHLISDKEFRQEFGEIDSVVMDGGLSGKDDLGFVSKLGALAGALVPATFSSGLLYKLVMGHEVKGAIEHDPDVLPLEVEEHLRSSADTSFSAAHKQLLFMILKNVRKMDLHEAGEEIRDFRYRRPLRDNVVDPESAVSGFSDAYDQPIEMWTDTQVEFGHAILPEWPKGAVDIIQNTNRDRYRISTRQLTAKAVEQMSEPCEGLPQEA